MNLDWKVGSIYRVWDMKELFVNCNPAGLLTDGIFTKSFLFWSKGFGVIYPARR